MIEELDKILSFNNLLISLKNHPDASRFAPGIGPVSLVGMFVGDLCMTLIELVLKVTGLSQV